MGFGLSSGPKFYVLTGKRSQPGWPVGLITPRSLVQIDSLRYEGVFQTPSKPACEMDLRQYVEDVQALIKPYAMKVILSRLLSINLNYVSS